MSLDRLSNVLTAIKNGQKSKKDYIIVSSSNYLNRVIDVFVRKGYLRSSEIFGKNQKNLLRINFKYNDQNEGVIQELKRISKQSCRIYVGVDGIPRVKNGYATVVMSTSKGIMTGSEARSESVGGEVICYIF